MGFFFDKFYWPHASIDKQQSCSCVLWFQLEVEWPIPCYFLLLLDCYLTLAYNEQQNHKQIEFETNRNVKVSVRSLYQKSDKLQTKIYTHKKIEYSRKNSKQTKNKRSKTQWIIFDWVIWRRSQQTNNYTSEVIFFISIYFSSLFLCAFFLVCHFMWS